MIKLTSFRAALLSRIVAGLGAASAAAAVSACGDSQQTTGGGGASSTGSGGAGGATTSAVTGSTSGATTGGSTSTSSSSGSGSSTSSTGTGMANVERCFPMMGGAACPDTAGAPAMFGSCTATNEAVVMWLSGPTTMGTDCCYQVDVTLPDAPQCMSIPGRPFMVEGQARVAPVRAGLRGWEERPVTPARSSAVFHAPSPCVDDLDEATRAQLGRAWATDGAFEHASVGSFGKLALELLSFGAPADLVRAAHEAALDEIGHAQMCFALASGYLGAAVGPGALSEARSFTGAATLADLAVAAVREGCFGETLAAVVVSEQHAAATDPAVREVLAIVAEEESRHAELSFRVVAWAVATGGEAVRSAVHSAFLEALAEVRSAPVGAQETTSTLLRAHGRLSTSEMRGERLRAVEEIVVPAMCLLLGAAA